MRIPNLDAAPMPAKKESGTDTTSAHGHETTKKLSPLYIQVYQSLLTAPPMTASKTAAATTLGV